MAKDHTVALAFPLLLLQLLLPCGNVGGHGNNNNKLTLSMNFFTVSVCLDGSCGDNDDDKGGGGDGNKNNGGGSDGGGYRQQSTKSGSGRNSGVAAMVTTTERATMTATRQC